MKIGLDFGTTNSIISYFNAKTGAVVGHAFTQQDTRKYIPSIVSIDENETLIGHDAKNAIRSSSIEIFSRFKMLLDIEDKNTLKEYGYTTKKPEEITKIYLEMLIEQFKNDKGEENGKKIEIDSIVLTVPEIWITKGLPSRSKIKKILEELNITPKLVSEPVSAGAYFLFKYKEKNKKEFNGHILVFDYGGGTLDIALLDTKDDHIKVLERVGKGKDNMLIGSAGVAYDEKLLHDVCWREGIKLSKNSEDYAELLIDIENKKIDKPIDKKLSNYIKDEDTDIPLFKIKYIDEESKGTDINICSSDMVKAFKSFENEITKSLEQIEKKIDNYNIDTSNSETFRVIMVGGFSSFYLSKQAVKNFFEAKEDDKRFYSYFEKEDNVLAISKGATLIAEKMINIEETYPLTVKLLMKKKDKYDYLVDAPFTIFKKGDSVESNNPIYLDSKIIIPGNIKFEFDYEEKDNKFKRFKKEVEKDIKKLFPNYYRENNNWEIGFSIDSNNFIYVHIKDKYNDENITELGKFLGYMIGE